MDRSDDLELLRSACRRGVAPLPPSAVRLALELAGDEDTSNERLIEQLDCDARLRLGMLIGANLPLFCGGHQIKSVGQAVAQMGRRKCIALLWLLSLSDFLQTWPQLHARARNRLWKHSLLTGVLTSQLLAAAGVSLPALGLAAGMAHDVGHLLLASPAPRLGLVWHEEHEQLVEREVSLTPERDHCRLGSGLLSLWNAPLELVAAALCHHDPAAAPAELIPLVAGVRLADLLAEHIDLERPARSLHLEAAPSWRQVAALEPWNGVPFLQHLVIERLPDSLLTAEHLASLLGV